MRVTLFIAVSGLLTLPAYAAELEVSVEIPKLNVAEYHRPYVAIWLEGADQKVASNLAVWYQMKDTAEGHGTKWLPDLRQWWRKSGRTLDVPVDGGPQVPGFRHALGNAYPNPMNPTTRIQFTNGVANGRVKVEIFDISGRLMRTLVDDRLPAGVHEVTWDGANLKGNPVPSGMYFYRMTADDFVSAKKLVVSK